MLFTKGDSVALVLTINIIGCLLNTSLAVGGAHLTAAVGAGETKVEDWCENKPINGKFSLAADCGVHKLSGQCRVNDDLHETAICIFNINNLEIVGSLKENGELPLIYRKDPTMSYRLFTVYGGAELTLKNLVLSGGDLTGLQADQGSGGAMFIYDAIAIVYNVVLKNNIAVGKGGGAIYSASEGSFIAHNTLVYNNSAPSSPEVVGGYGGGLFCSGMGTTCVLNTSSQILANYAHKVGGGLYCGRGSICSIVSESSVSQNVATSTEDDGIFCLAGSQCETDGTAFINSPWCLPGTKGFLEGTIMTKDNWKTQPPNSDVCENCLPGTYSDRKNANTCKTCPKGTSSILKAVACEGIPILPPKQMSNEELLWRLVLYSVSIVVGLFLMYKTCVFFTLKYTGRLNPDMPLWKAYLFTILYGNSSDDHVLPDGQRRKMDVAMNNFDRKKKSLLKNEDEGESLLESSGFGEMESGGTDETKENKPGDTEQEYTQL